MTQELLAKTIKEAAKATHKRLRQVEFRTQSPDHPILWAADESYYLKFFIFQVVDEIDIKRVGNQMPTLLWF